MHKQHHGVMPKLAFEKTPKTTLQLCITALDYINPGGWLTPFFWWVLPWRLVDDQFCLWTCFTLESYATFELLQHPFTNKSRVVTQFLNHKTNIF